MKNNIFLIPHNDKHILYEPIKGIISLINNAAAREIEKKINSGEFDSNQNNILNEYSIFPMNGEPIKNLTFILTNDCTMRCIYCYAEGGKNTTTLSLDTIKGVLHDIIKRINKHKPEKLNISFHGGDISSCWNLFTESVNEIKKILSGKINYSISLGINGVLSNKQISWIIQNTNDATVSCDGFDDIHNHQRPLSNNKNSFHLTDNTLKKLDAQNYKYGIRSTITDESVHHLKDIVAFFCKNYAANRIMVEPVFPMGRGLNIIPPSEQDFVDNFRKARQIAKSYGKELVYSGARLSTTTNIFCEALNNSCVITPDGLVSCCYEVYSDNEDIYSNFFYGYYNKSEKKLVFNNEKRNQLIEYLKVNQLNPKDRGNMSQTEIQRELKLKENDSNQ